MAALSPARRNDLAKHTVHGLRLQVSQLVWRMPWFIDMARKVEDEIVRIAFRLKSREAVFIKRDYQMSEWGFGAYVTMPFSEITVRMCSRDEYEEMPEPDRARARALLHTIKHGTWAIMCLQNFPSKEDSQRLKELLEEMNVLRDERNDRLFQDLSGAMRRMDCILAAFRQRLPGLIQHVWARKRVLGSVLLEFEARDLVDEGLARAGP